MRTLLLIPFIFLAALVIAFWLALGQYYMMHLTPEQIHQGVLSVESSLPWIRLIGLCLIAIAMLINGLRSAFYGHIWTTLLVLVVGIAGILACVYI